MAWSQRWNFECSFARFLLGPPLDQIRRMAGERKQEALDGIEKEPTTDENAQGGWF
jgi:hypothetical protein